MIPDKSFSFSVRKFNKLFPFYALVDKLGTLVSFGESIAKLCALEKGKQFSDYFVLRRPSQESGIERLHLLTDQVIILAFKANPKIVLRGQFELTHDEQVMFVGTPWFGAMDEVAENHLEIRDFAMHDPMIDLLHVLKSEENTNNEIKQLLTKVNQQKNVLHESEKRISSLILNLQTGILLEDERRHIVLCNRMFCDIFRIPVEPELLTGSDCSNAAEETKMMFKDPEGFVKRIKEVLDERKMVLSEKIEMADGRVLERDYMPIFVADKYKGHLWKYTDITDRENVDRKLRKQEEKYRRILENMKLGILEVNLDDEIQHVNSSFSELSGFSTEELIGRKAHQLLQVDNVNQLVEEKKALRMRGVSDAYELSVVDNYSRKRSWFVSGAPNYNDSGELTGSINVFLDVTDQKVFEAELRIAKNKAEESSKAKESFLANMSHEIRTPLNAIIGMVRELTRTNPTIRQSSYLRMADSASQHLLSIINNILDISKIEAGEFHLDHQVFNLRSVLEETAAILAPSAKDKMLGLTFSVPNNLAAAYVGDQHRIRQILLNIVSNSIKFTEKGEIALNCSVVNSAPGKQKINISIQDTGVGMDKAYMATLFKKFTQEDASIARKYGGTGLGMAITYELVQMMGGDIRVQSEKGVGTRFDLDLLLEIGNSETLEKSSSSENSGNLEGLRVLLTEDNEMNRLVVTNSLSRLGIRIEEAVNGAEAITKLKFNTFDLILMDLQMPVMDGLEATQYIRNNMGLRTPIIALTANAFKNEMEKCAQAGMNDYITKPFDEALLIRTIQKYFSKRKIKNGVESMTQPEPLQNSDNSKLYDLQQLEKMSHGNKAFVEKMIDLFCSTMPEAIKSMNEAWEKNDYQTVGKVAHRVKPNIDNLGIRSLHGVIRDLERIDPQVSDQTKVSTLLKHVEDTVYEVIASLKAGKR